MNNIIQAHTIFVKINLLSTSTQSFPSQKLISCPKLACEHVNILFGYHDLSTDHYILKVVPDFNSLYWSEK